MHILKVDTKDTISKNMSWEADEMLDTHWQNQTKHSYVCTGSYTAPCDSVKYPLLVLYFKIHQALTPVGNYVGHVRLLIIVHIFAGKMKTLVPHELQ